jgi:hypothetical protein
MHLILLSIYVPFFLRLSIYVPYELYERVQEIATSHQLSKHTLEDAQILKRHGRTTRRLNKTHKFQANDG